MNIFDVICVAALIAFGVWMIKFVNKREDERLKRGCEIIGTRIGDVIKSTLSDTDK